jgi:hypothetical protein
MFRPPTVHSAVVPATFVAVALWTARLLLNDIGRAIPGTHLGDNAAALWNVWWFAKALASGEPIFRTPMLFAPFGTQLSLHTHASTHSALAWMLTPFTSLVVSHNVVIICGLALNGICAFALARRLTSVAAAKAAPIAPSILAGVAFAFSAFVQLRVLGHINLLHAWVLPLFALALLRLDRRPRVSNAAWLGASASLVVYTDYYYFVYAALLTLIWASARLCTPAIGTRAPRLPLLRSLLLTLIVVDLLLIAVIARTNGTALDLGPLHISIRGVRNPLTVFWILLLAWIACRFPLRVSVRLSSAATASVILRLAAVVLAVIVLLTAPLWTALAEVVRAGDYTAPRILWRSSPPGADLLTLVLGHPLHLVSGSWTTSAYEALGIDVMEQSLWVGLVPLALIFATRTEWSRRPAARFCAAIAIVFFLLALGPFLRMGGADTALPLPYAALRYVPGFSNARIPGRAVVMVDLAIAMLTAFALAERRRWTPVVAILLLIETLPAPAPVQVIPPADGIDVFLHDSRIPGSVAELPLGLRDGFGETGSVDHRALVHQMWHQRPLVGGFVARLPSSVRQRYADTPLLATLLDLSSAQNASRLGADAAHDAAELGIPFVVVNRDRFVDGRLSRLDLEIAGFELVHTAGTRELYGARDVRPK